MAFQYSEADVRAEKIEPQLAALGWGSCSTVDQPCVRRETGREPEERGVRADYFLYLPGHRMAQAVVEAKRSRKSLDAAVQQGSGYARKLRDRGGPCCAVFVSDGGTVRAHWHDGREMQVNGEVLRELPTPSLLEQFVVAGSPTLVRGDVPASSRELIQIFKQASKQMVAEGLINLEAFAEFSQILFLKLQSELFDLGHTPTSPAVRWNEMAKCAGTELLDRYRRALKKTSEQFPGVCGHTEIRKPATLERIITCINRYSIAEAGSDVKGEAYEYFLREYNKGKSVLGQHFTPRHVVRAMVAFLDPREGETVYDPFCGTGGMLIEVFKRVAANGGDGRFLREDAIYGGEITRAAQTAKMNMVLAGDGNSGVERVDSLTTTKHKGRHDMVITNIPFRGGDEIDYVDHCLSSLKASPSARFAIVVPERVLDSDDLRYVALRERLVVDWNMRRVLSLPRCVFRGITEAKTAILYGVRGGGAKRSRQVPYVEVLRDGYTPASRRMPLPGHNDLEQAIAERHDDNSCLKLKPSKDDGWRLKPPQARLTWRTGAKVVPLREVATEKKRPLAVQDDQEVKEPGFGYDGHLRTLRCKEVKHGYNVRIRSRKRILPRDLVFSRLHTQNGLFAYADEELHGTSTFVTMVVDDRKVDRDYLLCVLAEKVREMGVVDTTGREQYTTEEIMALPIPLLPLDAQKEIGSHLRRAMSQYRRAIRGLDEARRASVDTVLAHRPGA